MYVEDIINELEKARIHIEHQKMQLEGFQRVTANVIRAFLGKADELEPEDLETALDAIREELQDRQTRITELEKDIKDRKALWSDGRYNEMQADAWCQINDLCLQLGMSHNTSFTGCEDVKNFVKKAVREREQFLTELTEQKEEESRKIQNCLQGKHEMFP